MKAEIVGVHRVNTSEPCHLIEMTISGKVDEFDWGAVTQDDPSQPRCNWQVAYDETPLDDVKTRWVFFFHYLNFSKTLLTPCGALDLPAPNCLPDYLRQKESSYVEP
jgi:hypothetical protein